MLYQNQNQNQNQNELILSAHYASVSGSASVNADLNLAADDRRTERSNHAGVIVLNIENINRLFFVFWKLQSKSTWLKNLRGHVPLTLSGHDASGTHFMLSFM